MQIKTGFKYCRYPYCDNGPFYTLQAIKRGEVGGGASLPHSECLLKHIEENVSYSSTRWKSHQKKLPYVSAQISKSDAALVKDFFLPSACHTSSLEHVAATLFQEAVFWNIPNSTFRVGFANKGKTTVN